jgi:hypothetical protein
VQDTVEKLDAKLQMYRKDQVENTNARAAVQ